MSPGAIEDVADDWNATEVYANASVVECYMCEDRVGCCGSSYLEVDESETDSSGSLSDGGDEDSDVDPDIELRDSQVENPKVGQEETTQKSMLSQSKPGTKQTILRAFVLNGPRLAKRSTMPSKTWTTYSKIMIAWLGDDIRSP